MQFDPLNTCRTCLSNDAVVDIFSESNLCEMLGACVRFQIQTDCLLPAMICNLCQRKLKDAYEFITKCEESNAVLLEGLAYNIKIEDEFQLTCEEVSHSNDTENHDSFYERKPDEIIEKENLLACLTKMPNLRVKRNNDNNEDKSRQCDICNKGFFSSSGYYKHRRTKHKGIKKETQVKKLVLKQKILKKTCSHCRKVFISDLEGFKEHIASKVCRDNWIFKCQKCGKLNQNKRVHEKHMSSHNFDNTPCEYCGKVFSKWEKLNVHVKAVHARDPDCICVICNKTLQNKVKLRVHMRKDHPKTIKLVECDMCGFTTKHKKSLEFHILSHNNIRPFKCRFCGKRFTHSRSIVEHENLHKGVRPYQCPVCSLAFTQKGNMKSHFRHNHKDVQYFELPKGTEHLS